MAQYRQLHVRLWQDRKVQRLSPLARLLFIHAWSNSHRGELCLYELTRKTMSDETGIPIGELDVLIDELRQEELISYDAENEVIWVRNALRYQTVTPKSFMAIVRDFSSVTSPIAVEAAEALAEVIAEYANRYQIPLEYLPNGIPILSRDYRNGKGMLPLPLPLPLPLEKEEGVLGGEDSTTHKKSTDKKPTTEAHRKEFEEVIWPPYPKKKDKQAAFKAYCARRNAGVPFEDLKTAEERYVAEVKRKSTQPDYVKNLATFFAAPKDRMPAPWQEYLNPNGSERPHSVLDTLPDLSKRLEQIRQEAVAS
ncbi:MAG: hypothetical protein ACM3X4_01545 [Ignavibacteriales bacterium]